MECPTAVTLGIVGISAALSTLMSLVSIVLVFTERHMHPVLLAIHAVAWSISACILDCGALPSAYYSWRRSQTNTSATSDVRDRV